MSGPIDFSEWLDTYEKAKKVDPNLTKADYEYMANDNRRCAVCHQHVWRYSQTGLCFVCTTGESDASVDYEIGEEYS